MQKYNCVKGYLLPYIIEGDRRWTGGRWLWWLHCLEKGEVSGEIPRIEFGSDNAGQLLARRHLELLVGRLERKSWSGARLLIQWLSWSLGFGEYPPEIDEEDHMYLYKNFKAGYLQKAPYDYFGDILSDRKGKYNPTAFFPTPHHLVEMITQMNMDSADQGKGIFKTVMDPCAGTSRMLLHASNYSVFLYGQDIDPTVVSASMVNGCLYAPWLVWPIQPSEEKPYYKVPESMALKASMMLKLYDVFMQQLTGLNRQEVEVEEPALSLSVE